MTDKEEPGTMLTPTTVGVAEDEGKGVLDELSEEHLQEFREIFNLVDKDGGGSISAEELGELMDTLGIGATQEEVNIMVNEIDQDGNGEIDFEEFVEVMTTKNNGSGYTASEVHNAFKLFEMSGHPGLVDLKHLEQVLLAQCKDLTQDQVKELFLQLDKDKEGRFNYEEYIKLMM